MSEPSRKKTREWQMPFFESSDTHAASHDSTEPTKPWNTGSGLRVEGEGLRVEGVIVGLGFVFRERCTRISYHRMYSLINFRESTPPQITNLLFTITNQDIKLTILWRS